jgi:hypothetical protein
MDLLSERFHPEMLTPHIGTTIDEHLRTQTDSPAG